jgi:hypothetical protein
MKIVFPTVARFRRTCLATVVLAAGTIHALAQAPNEVAPRQAAASILDRSPFLPPGFEPPQSSTQRRANQPQQRKNYEFRGVYQLAGEYHFLVSEARSRDGDWVSLRNPKPEVDFEIRDYDPQTQTLTLFANNKVEELTLASVEANPTPMPVTGQPRVSQKPEQDSGKKPVRRTIRPTRRTQSGSNDGSPPPPPAWLQKLRERAAERRAAAATQQGGSAGNTPGSVTNQGGPGGSNLPKPPGNPPTGKPPTPKPDFIPPPPPENLEIPEPPPAVKQRILDSLSKGG